VDIGRAAGLAHIYAGNLGIDNNTLCPGCGACLIERRGFEVRHNRIAAQNSCPDCGHRIAGVGMDKVKTG
jgi:pyruvate formate lyase activating enzyme